MSKFDIEQYEDDLFESQAISRPASKPSKPPKSFKRATAGKAIKGRSHKRLDKRLENEATKDAQGLADLFTKISAGASLEFKDNTKIDQYRNGSPAKEEAQSADVPANNKADNDAKENAPAHRQRKGGIVRVDCTTKTSEEQINGIIAGQSVECEALCRILGLRFVTADRNVIKVFQDPVNVPIGSTFRITDQYFENGCICVLTKIIRVNGIKFLFKRLDTGGFTSYTPVSLRDAKSIEYIGLSKTAEA